MRNFIPLCQKFMMLLGFGVLLNACGNDGPSYYSSDETFSSETETGSSSSVGISSSTPVVVSCSSSSSEELYSSSMDIEISSSSEVSSSSSYVQKSKVLKDSSIYYPEENRLLDLRDSQEYRTVVIGAQTWMAENLNYAYLEPGYLQDSSSFCFDNEPENCEKLGRFYMLSATVDDFGIFDGKVKGCIYWGDSCVYQEPLRGICPLGFHLPTVADFENLIEFVGGYEQAGKSLKSSSGWLLYDCDTFPKDFDCSDEYGFCAIPTGYLYDGMPAVIGYSPERNMLAYRGLLACSHAKFWTTSCEGSLVKQLFFLSVDDHPNAGWDYSYKDPEAYSIRCIKD
ncbi:MAG: FISUMP domain-containing protein [Fibrobacter intestinalis]|uniref:FISUMP domain-containing protein n=1 Tax=Fibrobacter intestinalis TaxID=28122 RepID=UPI003F095AFF